MNRESQKDMSSDGASQLMAIASMEQVSGYEHFCGYEQSFEQLSGYEQLNVWTTVKLIIYYLCLFSIQILYDVFRNNVHATYASVLLWWRSEVKWVTGGSSDCLSPTQNTSSFHHVGVTPNVTKKHFQWHG